ncbi:hypothetical protein DR950_01090 [Kitasatospora xanthocidica]|uniref:Uncharacterized protein n=1 Tax=Kitasatospora xanthocidica TaxID=83382 RepID=A0A372ZL40_9ACTN|nr:hypothetical protein DR950_01090 [Kitasatospora xanthocidica]
MLVDGTAAGRPKCRLREDALARLTVLQIAEVLVGFVELEERFGIPCVMHEISTGCSVRPGNHQV